MTVAARSTAHGLTTAQLLLREGSLRPTLAWPARRRRSLTLMHGSDGQGMWIGGDATVTPENGFYIAPGDLLDIDNYHEGIWAVSESGVEWLFAFET